MSGSKADKRVLVLFYLLIFYILIQFAWWAFMLIKLNKEIYRSSDLLQSKIWMVIGEGTVFFVFLLAGAYIMQRSIRKEMALVRQQRNFLLSITHELKTPLAAIRLCVETLEKHKNLDADKRDHLQKNALANTDRLSNLIDKVLLATRIESENEQLIDHTIDVVAHTQSIINRVTDSMLTNCNISFHAKGNIPLRIDPQNFDSILSNLLDNAIKYGGNADIHVRMHEDQGKVQIRVEDAGIGIELKNRSKIFDKFYRVGNEETRTKKGTGLGLFIVKKLVELQKGSITVEANKPQGTIFKVVLPQ